MPTTIEYTGRLQTCSCWCGMHLAVPASLFRQVHDLGKGVIYCPVGHQFSFRETELERERKRREQADAKARRAEERRQAERDLRRHTERQLSAQRGATTRARKRAKAAVCPVPGCKRSFVQMRRHLETKHPDYQLEEIK